MSEKSFDVYGLGAAIVDVLANISEESFRALHLERGTMRLVDADEQKRLFEGGHAKHAHMESGGSAANSCIAVAQLGGKVAFSGALGDDRYGLFYRSECDARGITFTKPNIVGGTTGTCLSLITPDAERTMRTHLGCAGAMDVADIALPELASAKWTFLESYTLVNCKEGTQMFEKVLAESTKARTRVAISVSEPFIANSFAQFFQTILPALDLLFANEEEARALSGADSWRGAFDVLKTRVKNLVVTGGAQGVLVKFGEEEFHIPAVPCTPMDLTGAGDMLAGAFLYGITHGVSPYDSARAGCALASRVITQLGARLPGDLKDEWRQILGPL